MKRDLILTYREKWMDSLRYLCGTKNKNLKEKLLIKKLTGFNRENQKYSELNFIILSGPSGVGKGTIISKLKKPGFPFLVSYTSRQARPNEKDGIDYHFVSKNRFKKMIEEKKFLVWSITDRAYHGFTKSELAKLIASKKPFLMERSVKSLKKLERKKVFSNYRYLKIFILPPTFEELVSRLLKRSKDGTGINYKIREAIKELRNSKNLYDLYLVNDRLRTTINNIRKLF